MLSPIDHAPPPTMPIADIKIDRRHRKDMGDIAGLAGIIVDVGLLHPPVVRPDGTLVVGARRLMACKLLGWTEVPVRVVDIDGIARGELAENSYRKAFAPSEMVAIAATVEERELELARERMTLGKISPGSEAGRARDKLAKPFGISGRTLEKMRAVAAAAEAEPDKYGCLVEQMDKSGKVDAAHQRLKYLQARERFRETVTPSTPEIICADCRDILPSITEPHVLISDPPYNQSYHYENYEDELAPEQYRELLRQVFRGKPAVVILYPEETINLLPALGTCQEAVAWCYPSNTGKQFRLVTWWNCRPDFSRLGQPYRNPRDKRIPVLRQRHHSGGGQAVRPQSDGHRCISRLLRDGKAPSC